MFTFRSVDDRTHPFLRGSPSLYFLFDTYAIHAPSPSSSSLPSSSSSRNISSVCVIPGHVVILLHNSSTLCVFDATPPSLRLNEHLSQVLTDILTKKKSYSSYLNNSGNSVTSNSKDNVRDIKDNRDNARDNSSSNSSIVVGDMLLWNHPSSPLIRAYFERGPPLRLVVCQADGLVFMWEWLSTDCVWKILTRFTIISSFNNNKVRDIAISPNLTNLNTSSSSSSSPSSSSSNIPIQSSLTSNISFEGSNNGNVVVWIEQNVLYSRLVQIPKLDTSKKRSDDVPLTPLLSPPVVVATFPDDVNSSYKFSFGKGGVWITFPSDVFFFSFRTQKILSLHIEIISSSPNNGNNSSIPDNDSNSLHQILSTSIHNITQELIVLDQSGSLFACDVQMNKILCTFLCSLPQSKFKEITVGDPVAPPFLLLKNHSIGVVHDGLCSFFDLQCGEFLEDVALPSSKEPSWPWDSNSGFSGAPTGFWSRTGMWELRASSVQKLSEVAAVHKENIRNVGCAAPICKDWGLERLEAKHLLEQILSQSDEYIKREASKKLIPMLESPAVLLALLSPTRSQEFLTNELQSFLDKYHIFLLLLIPRGGSLSASHKYLQISLEEQRNVSLVQLPQLPTVDVYEPSGLLKLGASMWENFARQNPHELLDKLELAFNLRQLEELSVGDDAQNLPSNFYIDPAIYEPEESITTQNQTRKIPLFELLCKLYYEVKPRVLPFFVELVNQGFQKLKGSPNSSPQLNKYHNFYRRALFALPLPGAQSISNEQITILCAAGNLADAMRLLLEHNRWEQSLDFARQKMDHDVDHFVLFQILLTQCLKAKNLERLQQIWEIMPHGFGIFDLLSLVKHYLTDNTPLGAANIRASAVWSGTGSGFPNLASGIVQQKVLCDSKNEIFTVEALRPQLLKMWSSMMTVEKNG